MTREQQIIAFSDDLDRLVERYAEEFDLTYAEVVGVLQMKICALSRAAATGGTDKPGGRGEHE